MMHAFFNYSSQIEHCIYKYIGIKQSISPYWDAANFPGEMPGMTCGNGKVRFPALVTPHVPIKSYIF